ncbi:hypothetical protein H4R35_003557 [Dimargaris xerosporica]|nr:hypothetical protein H4R35_003557 [Dimargaris xerosporica]
MSDPRTPYPQATHSPRSAPVAAPNKGNKTATVHPPSSAPQANAPDKSTSTPTGATKNGQQSTQLTDNQPRGWDETLALANPEQSNWQHGIDDYVSMQGGLASLTEPLSDSDPSEPETGAVFSAFSRRDKCIGSKRAIPYRHRSRSPRHRPRSRSAVNRRNRTPSRTRPGSHTPSYDRVDRATPRRPSAASYNRSQRSPSPSVARSHRSSPYHERSRTRDRRGSESLRSQNKSPGDAKPTVICIKGSGLKDATYQDVFNHFKDVGFMKHIDIVRPNPLIYFCRSDECDNAYRHRNGTYLRNSRILLTKLTEAEAGPCPKPSPHAYKWNHYSQKIKHRRSRSPSPHPSNRVTKRPDPDPSPPRTRSRPSSPPLRPALRRTQIEGSAHTPELSQEDKNLAYNIKHSIPRTLAQPVFCQAVISHRVPKSFSYPIVEYIRKRDVPIGAHDVAELVDARRAVDYFFDEGVAAVLLITYDLYKLQRVAVHVNTDRLLSRPKNKVNEDEHSKIQVITAKRLIIRDYQELARPRNPQLRDVARALSPSFPSPSPSTEVPSPMLTRPMPQETPPSVPHNTNRPIPNAPPPHSSLAGWSKPQDANGQSEPRRDPAAPNDPQMPMNLPHPSVAGSQLAYPSNLPVHNGLHRHPALPATAPPFHSTFGAPVAQPGAGAPPALGFQSHHVLQQAMLAFGAQIATGLMQNQGPLGGLAGLRAIVNHGALPQPVATEQLGLHSNPASQLAMAVSPEAPSSAPAVPAYSNPALQNLVDQMLRHPSLANRITPGAPPRPRPN